MVRGSLASRLAIVASLWSLAVLIVTALVLSQLYRTSVERAFDERLHVYLKALVAAVSESPEQGEFTLGNFGEPRFDLPLSGWYWQIRSVGERRIEPITSPSLFTRDLPTLAETEPAETRGVSREGYVTGPASRRLRMVERRIDFGSGAVYVMSVAADSEAIDTEIAGFVRTLGLALALLGIGVVLSTILFVRWGLSPLRRISRALADIRSGKAHRLEGGFPSEIAPLADEVNALIAANQAVVERARTHVGNLAHALKTPISVVMNEARGSDGPFARKVEEQVGVMRQQVAHHLERARAAARIAVTTETTEVAGVLDGLVRAMERIYRDRDLAVAARVAHGLVFRGERQDLEEMLGNLVDNACKWAGHTVQITAEPETPGEGQGPRLRITIDDDGPGMPAEKRAEALRRGQRLDESKPGSGLGLAIVADLATLYAGSFRLAASPQGGLRAEVILPAA